MAHYRAFSFWLYSVSTTQAIKFAKLLLIYQSFVILCISDTTIKSKNQNNNSSFYRYVLSGSEARCDLVLLQSFPLSIFIDDEQNILAEKQHDLPMKSRKVCKKTHTHKVNSSRRLTSKRPGHQGHNCKMGYW